MWARNLIFIGLCLFGFAALAANLLSGNHVENPQDFQPARARQDGLQALVEQLDDEMRRHWQEEGLQQAPRASDLAIARRLSLGLAGTVPSLEEIRALETQQPDHRLEWWTSRLLEDQRFADYLAERLARAYVGTENGPFLVYRRRKFVSWLSDRIRAGDPYDDVVRKLISGTGVWTDSPAVNFLTVTADGNKGNRPDAIRLAGRTTRAFLGMRIDCLQCHDDRLGNVELGTADDPREGLQTDFHQLAAFFSEAQSSLLGIVNREKDYEYKYLHAEEEEVISPAVPFLPELLEASETRRQQLANWVTRKENKPFARATVNRIWALMFGRPLVEPIDDIPFYGEFPPMLETLAADFADHDFDLRRLIRLIAATEAYQLDSRAEFDVTDEHERHWAVFPLTRLRPEQVSGALIQACSLQTIDANAHILAQLQRFFQQNEFIKRYGDMGEDEFEDRGGTVAQRLLMMNGNQVTERIKPNFLTNAASRIAVLAPDDEKAVETAYLVVLTRRPSPRELTHFTGRLADQSGDVRSQSLADLYWVLFNSTEFSWNH